MTRLTTRSIAALTKPGRYGDGSGLYLSISKSGNKSWALIFMLNKKSRQMGLGPLSLVTLAEARDKAINGRRLLLTGIDPIDYRRLDRMRLPSVPFDQFAEQWIAAHESGWRDPRTASQWRHSLGTYAMPIIGRLPPSAITVDHLMRVLAPIWSAKPVTAKRVRNRIEQILDAAKVRGLRSGDNPASWRGNLKHLLAARSKAVVHHPALAFADLPAFVKLLRLEPGSAARALEFLILTAARSAEVTGAIWTEVNDGWTIPGSRMKSGREHHVPLVDEAVELLVALPREEASPYLFLGTRAGYPLASSALLDLLKSMELGSHSTVHGFRSAFRDWASECTSHSSEVVEMALAHAISNRTEAAYRRGDLLEKRRALMRDWAAFLQTA